MNPKSKAVITLVVACAVLGGAWVILKHRSHLTLTVTLRISVTPQDQVEFVRARADSAQFKYLVGKQSGIKPVQAQKLALKPMPDSALVEGRLGGLTEAEARRYVEGFLPTLQVVCGEQVQLSLAAQSIH